MRTPSGVRDEPEVNSSTASFSSCGAYLSSSAGDTKLSASESGSASTVSTRGRSAAGFAAKMERTAAAERLLVSTTLGLAASRTALRWSPWPGSVGSYSGMATWQAYWAPRKPKRYSGLLPMSSATRSPGSPTCCRRAATALMRRLTSARV